MATSDWMIDREFVSIECDWSMLKTLRLQNIELTQSHVQTFVFFGPGLIVAGPVATFTL